jgi:AcrR family transcriptional regulator
LPPRTPRTRREQTDQSAAPRDRAGGTEQAFLRTATELFRDKGFHGTSISDVASAMGVTNASLYYYFSSKQDLLLRVLRSGMETFLESLEEIVATDLPAREKLEMAVANHLRFVFERGDAVAVFLRERRFLEQPHLDEYQPRIDRYDELFTSIIEEAVAAGELPPVDPRLASLVILGAINSTIEWYRPQGRLDEGRLAGEIIDLLLHRMLRSED